MSRLPVDVKLARMLVAAHELGCLREVTVHRRLPRHPGPARAPGRANAAAPTLRTPQFADPNSEFVGVLKLWDAYRAAHEELTQSKLRNWCEKHFLGFLRMREWRELHRQLLLVCEELGWPLNETPARVRRNCTAR